MAESDLVKLFGLKATNYLVDNCSIKMSNLQQNGRHNGHAFILAPFHVCDKLVKLHSFEFHGRKIIIEEAKTPPRTLVNKLSTSAVCIRLPAATAEEQKSNSEHKQYIFQCSYTKGKKHCTFFGQYTSRDENKTSKFSGEGRKNTLKSIPLPQSQSAESLRHSSVRGI